MGMEVGKLVGMRVGLVEGFPVGALVGLAEGYSEGARDRLGLWLGSM